ncbi:O-antigen ligase family protein [Pseudomonas sp. SDO528_S397]
MIIKNDSIKNGSVIIIAACISIFLIQSPGIIFYIGVAGILLVLLTAVFSPWLGLLALFPIAFSIRPAPPTPGLQEIAFAALLATIFIASLHKLRTVEHLKSALKIFGMPVLIGTILLSINLIVAINNQVPLQDWFRGVIPFLFIYTMIPISLLVGRNENSIQWLGASIGTLVSLTAGYIVFYYFYHAMWQPYWTIEVNGQHVTLSLKDAISNMNATGPLYSRITMMLAQATDALLPTGMVAGFVISTLVRHRRITVAAAVLSLLCLAAILITFTRSMLISAILVIFLFSLYLCFNNKKQRRKLSANLLVQAIFGLTFIFSTGIDHIWLGRLNSLSEAALSRNTMQPASPSSDLPYPALPLTHNVAGPKPKDFNVYSRVQEYKIAWEMFMSHPFRGNGIGIKHEMQWETSTGASFTERVAYVHNWPLYMLMVGGIPGLLIYTLICLGPAFRKLKSLPADPLYINVIRTAVITLAVYGLFFAVFRLISFNLLLAAAWGVIFTFRWEQAQNPRITDVTHTGQTKRTSAKFFIADKKNMERSV